MTTRVQAESLQNATESATWGEWDPRAELAGLTALRGIAAILVVVFHADVALSDTAGQQLVLGPMRAIVERGYLFVDLFFLLSGVVIAHVYGQRSIASGGEYRSFLWNRLARIYPMHLVATLLFVLPLIAGLTEFNDRNSVGSLASEFLLANSIGLFDTLAWNEVSWSISAEWFAYLLAPFILRLVRPETSSARVAVGVFIVSWGALLVMAHGGSLDDFTFRLGAVRGILGFAAGIALYRLHRLGSIATLAAKPAAFVISVLLTGVAVATAGNEALVIVAFAALILSSIHASGTTLKVLRWRPLEWLGQISYSVYLLQLFVLVFFLRYWDGRVGEGTAAEVWLWLIAMLVALCGVSTLTYRRIERPAQQAMRKLAQRS